MRDITGITTALIFRLPAFQKVETILKSKKRRLRKFTLFGAQKVLHARAFLEPLNAMSLGYIARPFDQLYRTGQRSFIPGPDNFINRNKKSSFISSIGQEFQAKSISIAPIFQS